MRRAADNPRPVATVLAVAGFVLVLAGCGEDDPEPGVSPPGTSQTQTATATTATDEDATTTTGEQMPIDTGDPTGAEPTGQPELGPGDILDQDALGATVRLPVGDEVTVQLAPPLQDATPRVEDPPVAEMVPVEYFADPGYAEYTLVAHGAGETTVTLVGPDGTEDLLAQVIVGDD